MNEQEHDHQFNAVKAFDTKFDDIGIGLVEEQKSFNLGNAHYPQSLKTSDNNTNGGIENETMLGSKFEIASLSDLRSSINN